jgi:glyoxylase-like metal-dependent hydrolase (beta-lactamase superfamily II)
VTARRVPLASVPVALAACAACAAAPGTSPAAEQTGPPPVAPAVASGAWAYEDLGGGVHASVTRPEEGYSRFANSLIVIGDSGVAVVDARESPAAARELIAYIRTLTDLPVVALIDSHGHWDHVNGNQAFADAFPGLEILGHPETGRWMQAEGVVRLRERIEALAARRDRLSRWLAAGARDDGRVLTDAEVAEATEIVRSDRAKIARFREVDVTPPGRAVTDSAVIDLGGRSIVVLHPGPAHTAGDLVVLVPDAALAFMGDLIEHGPPFFGDGTVVGSRDALARLADRGIERFLPGHGPTDGGVALFTAQLALLEDVVAATGGTGEAEAVARELARKHEAALPGFEGPDDPRLLEYLVGLVDAAREEVRK